MTHYMPTNTSTSFESHTPKCLENINNTLPLLLLSTPPISTGFDFPLIDIKFKNTNGGGDHRTDLLTLKGKTLIQTSRLKRKSLRLKLENSFLTNTHFTVNRVILSINYAKKEDAHLKILSFLSLQIDQRIAQKKKKKASSKRICPTP